MSSSSSSPRRHLCLLLLLLLVSLDLPFPATPTSFNYSTFDAKDLDKTTGCTEGARKICLKGDAAFIEIASSSLTAVQFTNGSSSSGYAVYSEPLPLYITGNDSRLKLTNFTTSFLVNLTKTPNNCSVLADGLAFFLSAYPHTIPPSSDDGTLGLVSRSNMYNATGASAFVAVEIDTYDNSNWDPSYVHLGIDVDSIRSVALANLSRLPAQAANKLDIVALVRVRYDSVAMNLTATVERGGVVYANLSYAVDLRTVLPQKVAVGISATSGYCPEYHKIMSWSFDSTWDPDVLPPDVRTNGGGGSSSSTLVIILSVAIPVALLVFLGVVWFVARRRRRRRRVKREGASGVRVGGMDREGDALSMNEDFEDAGGPRRLEYDDLVAATDSFDEGRKLGAGGSGSVYKGLLGGEVNREVAIKKVSSQSERGRKEYMAEVRIISRLRHRHLVQLVGWCHSRGELLLAYELMPNLSLDRHLFGDVGVPLAWPVRYGIAVGVASALLYLHEEGDRCVVHRDVKSSNIMLDEAFRAKLGDFGLARLTEHGSGLQTTMLGGTLGYMAPECFHTGRASTESDVYAFGVVALEIATGRRAIEEGREVRLVQWVWDLHATDAILEAADGRLGSEFDRRQMERLLIVGLWCVHPDSGCRPSIRKAMAALNFEDVRIELPKQMPVPIYGVSMKMAEGELPVDSMSTFSSTLAQYSVSSLYQDGR